MDSLQQSLAEMTVMFNTRMAEFQNSLLGTNTTSTNTSLAEDFSLFRNFVVSSITLLHKQISLLFKIQDQQEMRSRRKMLLVHGIGEEKDEDSSSILIKNLSYKMPDAGLSAASISKCHRIGTSKGNKPRPILVKFRDQHIKNKVWMRKTALKNSGVTISEFLTKCRHDLFMAARQHFGVNKCWTRDGIIFVIGSNGKKHRVESSSDLNSVPGMSDNLNANADPPMATIDDAVNKESSVGTRPKRYNRK
ncbi:unnamed protein product [Colias eurytheme]|nr:unnamed protein product [Colias eurytheme]